MASDQGPGERYFSPSFRKVGTTPWQAGTSLLRDGTLGKFVCASFHGLLQGQRFRILNARVGGSAANPFNGDFEVESVPSSPSIGGRPTSFTYRMAQVPASNAAGAPHWFERFQVRQLALERNVVELGATRTPAFPIGGGEPELRIHRRVAVRENVIRHADGVPNPESYAVSLNRLNYGVVQNNIISLARNDGKLLYELIADRVGYLNNQRPSGEAIRGWKEGVGRPEELFDRISYALVASL
jgi:hypothetical protein